MRVTTQMLNESARKAGLPIHTTSLLNYIKQDSGNNGLLSALSGNGTQNSVAGIKQKNSYEKMEKLADGLEQKAEVFLAKENTVFDKARETGDNKQVLVNIKEMIEAYNNTLEVLGGETDSLNRLYLDSLKAVATENASLLKEVGITASKDGTLVIDEDKLNGADLDALEEAFGSKGTFSSKTAFIAGRIENNAAANLESISSQYTSSGNAYTAALMNRYDFKG